MDQISTVPGINLEFLDLKDWKLPFIDEEEPEIVSRWGETINRADGYIIITPEYNHGYPAALKKARR